MYRTYYFNHHYSTNRSRYVKVIKKNLKNQMLCLTNDYFFFHLVNPVGTAYGLLGTFPLASWVPSWSVICQDFSISGKSGLKVT